MKKFLLLLAVLLGMAIPAMAGPSDCRPDPKKLKELLEYKIKYLAQEMELKEDQKQKFAELYERMSEEKRKNFESMRSMERKLKAGATEEEYKLLSDKISDCRIRDVQIEKEYDAKFAKFLTQKQIYKMKQAEEEFRKRMMDMHRKHRHEKRNKTR